MHYASIPMQSVGPFKLIGEVETDDLMVPMATYETPLWPSVARGARVSAKSGGIRVTVIDERMTRSILLQARMPASPRSACNKCKAVRWRCNRWFRSRAVLPP
jgi:Hydroxymethylglutaryl-CoA reductase